MVPATSCIAWVPLSRETTSRARYPAKRTAAMPAIGMIHWIAVAICTVDEPPRLRPAAAADRGGAGPAPHSPPSCEQTSARLPVRGGRNPRPDRHHLPRHPELRGPALPHRADEHGTDARAGPGRPHPEAIAPLGGLLERRHHRLLAARRDARRAVH